MGNNIANANKQIVKSMPFNWGSFAGGLGGGLISGISSIFTARAQRRHEKEMLKLQQDYDREVRDYNNPLNERLRLEQAGINPYGEVSDMGWTNPTANFQDVEAPYPSVDIQNMLNMALQSTLNIAKTKSEIAKTDQETKQLENYNYANTGEVLSRMNEIKMDKDVADTNLTNEQISLVREEVNKTVEETKQLSISNWAQDRCKELIVEQLREKVHGQKVANRIAESTMREVEQTEAFRVMKAFYETCVLKANLESIRLKNKFDSETLQNRIDQVGASVQILKQQLQERKLWFENGGKESIINKGWTDYKHSDFQYTNIKDIDQLELDILKAVKEKKGFEAEMLPWAFFFKSIGQIIPF